MQMGLVSEIIYLSFFQNFLVDGFTINKGQTFGVFIHYLHRNPVVWEKPDEFLPERFMEETALG